MENNMESKRSSTPPCPGKIYPESFTPSSLLNMDSIKSPKVPVIITTAANPIHISELIAYNEEREGNKYTKK